MKKLVGNFSNQIREAIAIGKNAAMTEYGYGLENVIISGLGGSGIGGSIASHLTEGDAKIPVSVNKNYFLPRYVNSKTLVIICSYSGNTEETVNCLKEAIKKNAKIVCITSGGKIAEEAIKNKLDLITMPGGMPPRSCLGYSLIQLFYVLNFFGVINTDFEKQFEAAADLLDKEENSILIEAKLIAEKLFNKTPVIYSEASTEGISIRFRQQLNENSKILCWHHVFPEMNHNEIVGWRDQREDLAVIILRNNTDYERTQKRMEISKQTFKKYCPTIIDLYSKGNSAIEKTMYLVNITDWISCFLADLRGVDPVEVNVIDHLKSELIKS
jgi:glucose/mannose-6-phosphate isomerase